MVLIGRQIKIILFIKKIIEITNKDDFIKQLLNLKKEKKWKTI